MTQIVNHESSASPKTDSAEGGWVVLDAETNQIVSRDHDPALARQKAVESGVLRPILLGAKSVGITMRGAITVRKP